MHTAHPHIDGVVHVSRLTNEETLAVLDRGVTRQEPQERSLLTRHLDRLDGMPDSSDAHATPFGWRVLASTSERIAPGPTFRPEADDPAPEFPELGPASWDHRERSGG